MDTSAAPLLTRRAWLSATLSLAAGVGLAGCGAAGSAAPASTGVELVRSKRTRDAVPATEMAPASVAVQDFSATLFSQLTATPGNLVCSPYSAHLALAMTLLGARGNTATEMADVLRTTDAARLGRGLNALSVTLAGRAGVVPEPGQPGGGSAADPTAAKREVVLDGANSLWGQRGLIWEPAFLDALAADFGSGMRVVDFVTNQDTARSEINSWVSQLTRGTIPELITPGALTADSRLVLVNALYFKAPWATAFLAGATHKAPFTRTDGTGVTAEYMSDQVPGSGYAAGPGWRAVRLPYAGGKLAMTLVLPDAGRMATLQQLEGPTLRRILTTPILANVQVTLPRWTTRSSLPLKPALTALGMPTAFTDSADFSGMTTKATLKIGAVLHQGWIAVDEAGTEASAATAVEMRVTSGMAGEPVTVSFDRPFLYVVHDVVTGTPLFLGRLSDPTAT